MINVKFGTAERFSRFPVPIPDFTFIVAKCGINMAFKTVKFAIFFNSSYWRNHLCDSKKVRGVKNWTDLLYQRLWTKTCGDFFGFFVCVFFVMLSDYGAFYM